MRADRKISARFPLPDFEAALRPRLAEILATDLALFTREAWHVLRPGREFIWSWHYEYLCEVLTLVKQRQLRRLIVNVPPRSLKSTLITVMFPVWIWITEPHHDILSASYSMVLSTEHSAMRRDLIQSHWFQSLWGDRLQLAADRNQIHHFMNNHRGEMTATSIEGSVLGRNCDTAILDDILSAQQALSSRERTRTNNWITTTLRTRLNDPATGSVVLVMQRLHETDPSGYLLKQEPQLWHHVRIPLIAEEDEKWVFPISGKIVCRKTGEILMPQRFPPAVVEELRSHREKFAGQYQQRPSPDEGNLIKRQDLRFYGGIDPGTGLVDEHLPTAFERIICSVDCSFKASVNADYVAILIIGIKGRKRFVLNIVNAHLDAAATEYEIRRQRNFYRVNAVLVEDAANGQAIIQRLKTNVPGVISVNPQGGKLARLSAAAAEWQAGDWFLDRNAAWTEPFIEQITVFPCGEHDDMADAMSQAACWLLQTPRVPIWTVRNAFTSQLIEEHYS